jgi:hypothetical protein
VKDVGQLSPAPLLDGERSTLDRAFDLLKGDRPNPIQATMALLRAEGLTLGGAEAQSLLAELLVDVLDDLEADALAPEALSFFDGLDPPPPIWPPTCFISPISLMGRANSRPCPMPRCFAWPICWARPVSPRTAATC